MEYLIRKMVCGRFPYYLLNFNRRFPNSSAYECTWTGLKNNAMAISEEATGWMIKEIQERNPFEKVDKLKKRN